MTFLNKIVNFQNKLCWIIGAAFASISTHSLIFGPSEPLSFLWKSYFVLAVALVGFYLVTTLYEMFGLKRIDAWNVYRHRFGSLTEAVIVLAFFPLLASIFLQGNAFLSTVAHTVIYLVCFLQLSLSVCFLPWYFHNMSKYRKIIPV